MDMDMDSLDPETIRQYLLEHTDLATRFPNWSSTINLTQIVQSILDEDKHLNLQEPLSEEELAEAKRLGEVTTQFKRHYLWAIVALGVPGNLASLLTFLHMRSLGSCVVYVAVLAVVDCLALLEKLLLSLLQQHGVRFTPATCKTLLFLANALVIYANWIVVALAAERLFAVYRPLALGVYWTRSRAGWAMAVLLVLCLLVCVPVVVFSIPREDALSCVYAPRHRRTAEAWHWVNVTLYGFLPCLLLLSMNMAIISLLRKARRQQLELCPTGRPGSQGRPRPPTAGSHRQASLILLVASFVLIVLTTPRCAMLLLQQLWRPKDYVLIAKVHLFKQVTHALSDLNHAINFFLYFVSARHFRRRFLDLFRSSAGWKGLQRLSTRDTVQQRILDSTCDSGIGGGNVAMVMQQQQQQHNFSSSSSSGGGKGTGTGGGSRGNGKGGKHQEEGCCRDVGKLKKDTSV